MGRILSCFYFQSSARRVDSAPNRSLTSGWVVCMRYGQTCCCCSVASQCRICSPYSFAFTHAPRDNGALLLEARYTQQQQQIPAEVAAPAWHVMLTCVSLRSSLYKVARTAKQGGHLRYIFSLGGMKRRLVTVLRVNIRECLEKDWWKA